ncbi:hypothetical protein JXA88_14295, partial [Candidatus Fermentibacteria bacterium]|nr:hypothetical protein [Candidatus Fermentibacteria bacterium]
MRFFSSSRARQRGIALVMAALSLVILGILATGFIVGSITEHRMSLNEIQATSAVQLADGGARAAFQWLVNSSPPPCQNSGTISPLGTMAIGTSGTAYPTITYADTNDCSNQYQGWGYTIRSVGTTGSQRNATVELKAIVQRKNFTCYAIYLGEYCPDPPGTAWFGDWDRVTGPVHSNCRLWLSQRDPPSWTGAQFWGRVTIVEPAFRLAGTPHYTRGDPACYASFYEGYETEVEGHDWPPSLANTVSCIGAMGGLTLTGETRLIFRPNGSVLIKNPHTQPYRGFWPEYVGHFQGNYRGIPDSDTLNLAYDGVFLNGTAIRVRGPANVSPDIIVQGTYAG